MAELNLKQIVDRLNAEFTGDTRKLVFWYDDKGEFAEDIDQLELANAKVYRLQQDNQFYTKYFLERVDRTTNYLIYAPFSKPDVKENHLEDTLLYSRRFFADRASLLSVDLGIEEKYKPIIEKYIKFFANKDRTKRFYDLEIEHFNEKNIIVGLLSVLCKAHTCSFEEVVRVVLTESELENNLFMTEFGKYDLTNYFWKLCEQHFGYIDDDPTLEKLVITLFATYTEKYISSGVPKNWKPFVSVKSGNVIAFLDNLMNSILYREKYNELSKYVSKGLGVSNVLKEYPIEELLSCDTFFEIDQIIITWLVSRLVVEDTGVKVDDLSIPEICDKRSKMHFGNVTFGVYQMLTNAYSLILRSNYAAPEGFNRILKQYKSEDYKIDEQYRKFYLYYDKLENSEPYEQLRTLVENIYTNEYLTNLLPKWNEGLQEEDAFFALPQQRNFYDRYIRNAKERTVVIISDAMRYEVGRELFHRMQDDPKCTAKMEMMLSVLPSYTQLGMAALLPHKLLTFDDQYKVLVDDMGCDSLAARQQILQKYSTNGVCVQFDELKNMKATNLRSFFTGKDCVYIYHNQIDARGDKAITEDEVFVACEEAITEIMDLIRKVSNSANTYHFIVTADHGFIYKREKITESDKISGITGKESFNGRRFVVANEPVVEDGVQSVPMSRVLGNDDNRVVSFPVSSNVFKVTGGGQNYVHGGSSPQEMLLPLVDIKMERGKQETKSVEIALVSMVQKITNLITSMDFIQSDPISDTVKAATYKIFFISEENEKISNENILVADSREADAQKRITRMRFTFKNKQYNKHKQYYLVVYDDSIGLELFRHPVIMDLAFVDDFGF